MAILFKTHSDSVELLQLPIMQTNEQEEEE